MNIFRFVATVMVLLLVGGCGNGRDGNDLTAPSLTASSSSADRTSSPAHRIATSGQFDALVDVSTLTLTPRGRNCLLEVAGRLVFTGTFQGTAVGRTRALVSASCAKVATTPPARLRDIFKSELVFNGTVDGAPARANLLYSGGVEPGGRIEGRLLFFKGVAGTLKVEAKVAVGGKYRGAVVVS